MLFSLAATLAQRALYELRLLSPMMEPATTLLAGGLLLAAGVYQLLPVKRTCLASCRGLAALRRQDRTVAEAFRAGMHYGRACLASNWLLMLLLFAGGVMNLAVIAALTGVVLVEGRATWHPEHLGHRRIAGRAVPLDAGVVGCTAYTAERLNEAYVGSRAWSGTGGTHVMSLWQRLAGGSVSHPVVSAASHQ